MNPDPSSLIPRYAVSEIDGMLLPKPQPSGSWCRWADVEARLAQLAQEQATTAAIHKQELENCGAAWEDERARRHTAEDALDLQLAALGETRQALQHAHAVIVELHTLDFSDELQAHVDAVLIACQNSECARVDTTGSADGLVPQVNRSLKAEKGLL